MVDDFALLRSYATDRSDDAFAELVRRYVGLVYFSALRQVGADRHLAEDVCQEVFATLSLEANKASKTRVLAGWLYSTTRHKAAHAVEAERRRKVREHKAYMTDELLKEAETSSDWDKLSPVIDDALSELKPPQRDVVLLRFFHECPFADIGTRLGIENYDRTVEQRGLVSQIASSVYDLEPVTSNQGDQLVQIFATNTSNVQGESNIDWGNVLQQAQTILSPNQLAVLKLMQMQNQASQGLSGKVAKISISLTSPGTGSRANPAIRTP